MAPGRWTSWRRRAVHTHQVCICYYVPSRASACLPNSRSISLRSPLAELLRSEVSGSMRALARVYGSEQYQAWGDLLDSIRTGQPAFGRVFRTSPFEYFARNPSAGAVFHDAMTG